jgi:hypothetical protein
MSMLLGRGWNTERRPKPFGGRETPPETLKAAEGKRKTLMD